MWDGAEGWARHCNAFQRGYHGGEFTGGACKRLLSKKSQDYLSLNVPAEYLTFHRVICTLDKVVKSCYGYKLASTYKQDIASFKAAYRMLKVNDTTKIHIVVEHLAEFIELSSKEFGQKTGLAPYTGLFSYSTIVSLVANIPVHKTFH